MLIAAHRGSSGSAPENTMAAFYRAAVEGADMIELDVRFSRDLHPVVIHDRTLRRTTDGSGRVDAQTLAALQRVDAGRRWAPAFTGQRIPTLVHVLAVLPGRVMINIEVKTEGDRRNVRTLAQHLAETLHRHCGERGVIVSSFNHRFLKQFHDVTAATPIGALIRPIRDAAVSLAGLRRRTGASLVIYSRSQLRHRKVREAHSLGLRVGVYTVNTIAGLDRVRRYGVDIVYTNHPALVRGLLRTS